MTSLVLAPLALAAIFLLPEWGFAIFIGAILLVGTWEFIPLSGLRTWPRSWLLVPLQAAIFWAMWHSETLRALPAHVVQTAFCGLWGLLFLRLVTYRRGTEVNPVYRAVSVTTALVAISIGWYALVTLRAQPEGAWWLVLLLLIIWSADTGAYFAGQNFGRHKLAPALSPGKTWEGLAGGLLAAVIVALLVTRVVPALSGPAPLLALTTISTVLASVCGDLMISMHKRITGVKDAGGLFPGHGGVLDRLDSLVAGASFFLLGKLVFAL